MGLSQLLPYCCLHLGTGLIKSLETSTKKYLITKRNSYRYVDCRVLFEMRKQLMAWMEMVTSIAQKIHTLMKAKMVAGAFGHIMNYG